MFTNITVFLGLQVIENYIFTITNLHYTVYNRYTRAFVLVSRNQPGHSAVLQVLVSLEVPSHLLPPGVGTGPVA